MTSVGVVAQQGSPGYASGPLCWPLCRSERAGACRFVQMNECAKCVPCCEGVARPDTSGDKWLAAWERKVGMHGHVV